MYKLIRATYLVYGEMTTNPSPVDELYRFFILSPLTEHSCKLEVEMYWKAKSPAKKLMITLFAKRKFRKGIENQLNDLLEFAKKRIS